MSAKLDQAQFAATDAAPRPLFGLKEAVAVVVGNVIGSGIFKLPPLVAKFTGSVEVMMIAWVLGGVVSILGALCYAELGAARPDAGGEYHFLDHAFGRDLARLFAWARMTVICSGSIALFAFVFGDYATQLLNLGPYSAPIYSALLVIALTAINVAGVQAGKHTQNWLTVLQVAGLLAVIVAGFFFAGPRTEAAATSALPEAGAFGLAMVFVLYTYGGWNDAAYLTAEIQQGHRNIARSLILGLGIVTVLYLLVSLAYLNGLGFAALAKSDAVAADLLRGAWGPAGAALISVIVGVCAIAACNATILTGGRSGYALGRDWALFRALGVWKGASLGGNAGGPRNALILQGAISLALVAFGSWKAKGVEAMVDYTAPVFWLFFFLTGMSLFIFRQWEPNASRPFKVPFYPLTPLVFCGVCIYMLYSSLAYAGAGALVGVGVLLVGVVLLAFDRRAR
ncbi:MAG TPA: amino acid permease [Burkholderiales bacterium]|nr:amino acid permease [Burkholderiales bacterium]